MSAAMFRPPSKVVEAAKAVLAAARECDQAERRSKAAMSSRMALRAGSTRARSTTANARWAQAAEGRDHKRQALENRIAELQEVMRHG